MNELDFRQDEEVGARLRRLAALSGLRPSIILRVLVQNAPPVDALRGLADAEPNKHNCAVRTLAGNDGAIVATHPSCP